MKSAARRFPSAARRWPLLARYAVAMSRQDQPAAARALRDARRAGTPRVAAEETALMLMLYCGYPAVLEGLRVLNKTWPGRVRPRDEGTVDDWLASGERLCARVYGAAYPRLVANVGRLHPHVARWMVEHGYGRVLSRRGLSAKHRELVTVAVLAASGWKRQLHSHLLGAVHVGAQRAEIRRAMVLGMRGTSARTAATARRAWRLAFEA